MSRRIAIVDDDKSQKIILKGFCTDAGYEVVAEGSNGVEAVTICESVKPEVMVLDVCMPEKDGIAAAIDINSSCPTPIVLLTALDDSDTIKRAAEAGVMAYLVKPIRGEELMPAIELALVRFNEIMDLKDKNKSLEESIEARKVVERAKGLLMSSEGLSEQDAFSRLRKLSMDRRKSMKEIAEVVIGIMQS